MLSSSPRLISTRGHAARCLSEAASPSSFARSMALGGRVMRGNVYSAPSASLHATPSSLFSAVTSSEARRASDARMSDFSCGERAGEVLGGEVLGGQSRHEAAPGGANRATASKQAPARVALAARPRRCPCCPHLDVLLVRRLPLLWRAHHQRARDLARDVGAQVDGCELDELLAPAGREARELHVAATPPALAVEACGRGAAEQGAMPLVGKEAATPHPQGCGGLPLATGCARLLQHEPRQAASPFEVECRETSGSLPTSPRSCATRLKDVNFLALA